MLDERGYHFTMHRRQTAEGCALCAKWLRRASGREAEWMEESIARRQARATERLLSRLEQAYTPSARG